LFKRIWCFFGWPCISICLCNKDQLDALFILSLFPKSTSTCFSHICSPSSGGILYIYNNWYVSCFSGQQTVNWKSQHVSVAVYIYSTPPHDGLQISLKHVEIDWGSKLRINSATSWSLLHRICILSVCILKILKMSVKIYNCSTLIFVGSCFLLCILAMYVFTVSGCVWVRRDLERTLILLLHCSSVLVCWVDIEGWNTYCYKHCNRSVNLKDRVYCTFYSTTRATTLQTTHSFWASNAVVSLKTV